MFLFTVASAVPATKAYSRLPYERGTNDDADYYALVSNSMMGILCLLTMIIPIVQQIRLKDQLWPIIWTSASFLLTVVSIVAFIAATICYTSYSVRFSILLTFMASALQALITLLLTYTVSGEP